jgi:hypothetical protein
MKIRLGGPSLVTKHNRIPANESMIKHANQEIDYNLATSSEAYENALQVDGVQFALWRRVNEGRRCSCKDNPSNPIPADSRFEEFSRNKPVENNDVNTVRVRGSWDRQRQKPNVHGKELGVEIGLIKPDDASDKQVFKKYPSTDQQEINAFLNGPLDISFLGSGEGTTACGICFGTGFTNGYSLFNGVRITLDALNHSNVSKFSVDRTEHPFIFKTDTESRGQYVEWSVELPLFKEAIAVLVRNNLVSARQMQIQVLDATQWVAFDVNWLNKHIGSSLSLKLRVSVGQIAASHLEFSHVEIILKQAEFKYTQVGQLQRSRSFTSAEPVMNTEFALPPSIGNVEENDIIVDDKYEKAWLVTDVTDFKISSQKIANWSVTVRSLTSFDIPSLLRLSKLPDYQIAFNGLNEDE